jgi:hypothetical protein
MIREMLDPLGHKGNLEVSTSGVTVTLLEVSKVNSVIVCHFSGNRDGPSRFIAAKPSFDARGIGENWEQLNLFRKKSPYIRAGKSGAISERSITPDSP